MLASMSAPAPRIAGARVVTEDTALLARALKLDRAALADIHDTYYPPLYRYMVLRVGDRHVAEDLTSEVFTRLLTALHRGPAPQTTLRGWLFGVASKLVADHQRALYRRGHAELDPGMASPDEAPSDLVEKSMAQDALFEAIDHLTDDQRDVIALRYGSGLPLRDVAEQMGKTEGAVKQLLARAVTRLSKTMVPMAEGGG